MEIKGERVTIRNLRLEDVFEMRKWGYHDNPLLEDYNFPHMSDKEIRLWYRMKVNNLLINTLALEMKMMSLLAIWGLRE